MYRVKRCTLREEMSPFFCFPKRAWVTSQSAKRLPWTINDSEEFKRNSYFLGVRRPLAKIAPARAEEPIAEEEEDEATEGWSETVQRALECERMQSDMNRFYSTLLMGLLRSHRVVGMTAQDLPRVSHGNQ